MTSITSKKNHPAEIRRTLELATPVMIGLVASFGMNFVDTVMAGRLAEKDVALAALATGGAVWSAVLMFTLGILMAIQPTVAQLDGSGACVAPLGICLDCGLPLLSLHNQPSPVRILQMRVSMQMAAGLCTNHENQY